MLNKNAIMPNSLQTGKQSKISIHSFQIKLKTFV